MERDWKKCTPSLRRNYPVQVQRVLSQPRRLCVSHNPEAPRGNSEAKIGIQEIAHNCNFNPTNPLNLKNTPMKKMISAMVLALGLISAYAQNEKNVVVDANAEVRKVAGFSAVEVSGAIDLYLSQGNEEAVAISASSEEIKSRIRTEVRGSTLRIYLDGKGINWKLWNNNKMKAYVTFKTLTGIEASGACNVKAASVIRQNELKIELSGASDFNGEVAIGKLKLDASGASNIKISGKAESTILDASGACNIKAYDLITDMCKIEASGASNIKITVNKELNAQASGGSSVFYKGSGLIRDISASGGATVKHRTED